MKSLLITLFLSCCLHGAKRPNIIVVFINLWPDDVHGPFSPPLDKWGGDKRALYQIAGTQPSEEIDGEDLADTLPVGKFVNPIGEGADPWVIRDPNNDRYLWCFSEGNRGISIHTSDKLTSFGEKHEVWTVPESGPYSRQIWAPELHFLQGKWIIYFAASDGENENHLAYALQSKTEDPLGEYDLHGPFQTGDTDEQNLWAIDMTPLEHQGKLYALWSGWDGPRTDQQFLYIAEMISPVELASKRVLLCANDDYPWEFTEGEGRGRGLHEGPQVLANGDRTFVTYSCGASWLPTYKLGMLELTGSDPLDPASWKKFANPVFQSTEETYGVGHSCFVKSPDKSEWWHIFHAKRDPDPGWRRAVFGQPFKFTDKGLPDFGKPVPANRPLPRPAGEPTAKLELPYNSVLKSGSYSYFGHHQFYRVDADGLTLGIPSSDPINSYRCGEKIVLDARMPDDFTASVTLDFRDGRGAGLLFRITAPSVGYDAQRGYFAGLKPSENVVLLGKMNGSNWQELARQELAIDVAKNIASPSPPKGRKLRSPSMAPRSSVTVTKTITKEPSASESSISRPLFQISRSVRLNRSHRACLHKPRLQSTLKSGVVPCISDVSSQKFSSARPTIATNQRRHFQISLPARKRVVKLIHETQDALTMRLKALLFSSLVLVGSVSAEDAKGKARDFVPLFDGKTTEGWTNPYSWGKAEVVDGEIHLTGERKFFLVTGKEYANFVFEGDIHLPEGPANSGFMFRAHVEPNNVFGYQAEVDGDEHRKWAGGLYDEGRRQWFISPKRDDKKSESVFRKRAGDAFKRNGWNTYRITCKGDHLKIEVNGVVTTDVEDDTDASGVLGIQHHGEKGATYRFRNLRIKELM